MRKIVVMHPDVVLEQGELIIAETGVNVVKTLPIINAFVCNIDPESDMVSTLSNKAILRIEDDVKVYAVETAAPLLSQPPQRIPSGVNRIHAVPAWSITKGAGIKVGVIDTGIDIKHPDLKVLGGINTISNKRNYTDDNGHGTHVAGTIAALKNAIGVIGVAPAAKLYAVKVLNASGSGYISDVIEGLQWSMGLKVGNQTGIKMDVINMSLGLSVDVPAFHDAIIKVFKAGVLMVAAAGNSGCSGDTVIYPAKYNEVIAVSAINDEDDSFAYFSSCGPAVDLIAPGVSILSTYKGSTYRLLSGTSMATPHVTGTAALVLSQFSPTTRPSPTRLMAHLKNTTEDLGLPATQQGEGLVNAYGAVTNPVL
ncbi:MAG: S8 family peptidase [Carboxydocellales bacterium]